MFVKDEILYRFFNVERCHEKILSVRDFANTFVSKNIKIKKLQPKIIKKIGNRYLKKNGVTRIIAR